MSSAHTNTHAHTTPTLSTYKQLCIYTYNSFNNPQKIDFTDIKNCSFPIFRYSQPSWLIYIFFIEILGRRLEKGMQLSRLPKHKVKISFSETKRRLPVVTLFRVHVRFLARLCYKIHKQYHVPDTLTYVQSLFITRFK